DGFPAAAGPGADQSIWPPFTTLPTVDEKQPGREEAHRARAILRPIYHAAGLDPLGYGFPAAAISKCESRCYEPRARLHLRNSLPPRPGGYSEFLPGPDDLPR